MVISTKIHKSFLILILVAIAAIIYSCEEDPTVIGKDLFPAGDFSTIKSTDTLSVFGYTAYNSPVRSDGRYFSYLGKLSDPYFGETKSDFVSQLQLYEEWQGGGAFTVDSVKFFMAVVDFEGSTTTPQSINICEITDQLTSNTVYYSDITINKKPGEGDFGTYPLSVDLLREDTITTFIIPLPISVGEYLMRDTTKLFRSSTEPDFNTFFKGLYVSMVDSPNPLFLTTILDAEDPGAGIVVYYHNSADTLLTYSFWMNENAVSVNRSSHSAKNGLPGKDVVNVRVRDTVTYLQNYDGVFTRLEIPGLEELKSLMPISVNKARLRMPVFFDSLTYTPSTVPGQVLIRYKNATGGIDTVPDYMLSPSYLDGTYNKINNEFTFNIAVFTQLYLEGAIPEPIIELFLPVGTSKNLILNMNENTRAAKLEFTYTKF